VPDNSDAIISIHPDYANAILAGTKTIELRRRVPDLSAGTRLWIYATQPRGAVVGHVTVKDVIRASPGVIWNEHRNGTAVEYKAFKAYFNGSERGVAIHLDSARRVTAITIDQLRRIRDGFHPPQTLTRLTSIEAEALRVLAAGNERRVSIP
jgi:predicted transcriptional regulator